MLFYSLYLIITITNYSTYIPNQHSTLYMASDETMTFQSSFQDEDFEDDLHLHLLQNPNPHHNLSRLSVCTSSTFCGTMDDDVDNLASMCMSRLSIESFEGDDADGEFSDGKELQPGLLLSSGSENESGSCYSLPATPPRRRKSQTPVVGVKEYASENELVKKEVKNSSELKRRRRRRRMRKDMWEDEKENSGGEKSDQSTGGGGGGGVMVIARPKGGKRSLCMDLEEVKACKDLGFELEHERMLDIPSRLSFSNSTLDTSSGGNSPIANWRISSPGDDPRDVKARLKVWAQAVALASTSSKFS